MLRRKVKAIRTPSADQTTTNGKKFILFLLFLGLANFAFSYTITRFDQTLCASSFPTSYVSGSFSIAESAVDEFTKNQTNKTIIISIPSGFAVNTTAGTYSVTGTSTNDITSISISAITASSITIKLTTSSTTLDLNTITVTCQLHATAASSGTLVRNGGNFRINKSTANPTASQSLGNLTASAAMAYTSSTTAQPNVASTAQGTSDNDIIQVQVVVSGTCNTFNVTQLNFSTTGSTNASTDISSAKVYYTGTTNAFSTTTLFGSVSSPNGSFIVTGTQALTAGTNYFWLAYNVPSNATVSNVLDAQCTSVTMDGGIGAKTPSTTSPTGTRSISALTQYYSRATGNWNDNTNWSNTDGGASCSCQPNGTGNVFVNTNHTITLDATRTVDYVTIRDGGVLKDNGTNTLTVSSNMNTLLTGKFTATSAWTISGNLVLSGTGASTTTKSLTVTGNTTVGSGTSLTENGISGNDLTLKGSLFIDGTLSSGTSGGTIILNGSSAQNLSTTSTGTISGSGALTLSTSAKTFAINSVFTVSPAIAISGSITVTNNGTVTASGNVTGTVSGSTWVNAAGSTLKVGGTLLSTGTLTATASNTVEYNLAGDQSIKATTYYNLTLSQSGTKTFPSSATTVTNMLTLSGSVIGDVGTNTVSGVGGLTMSGTTEFKIAKTTSGAAVVPELTGVYNLSGGTVTFNQTGSTTQTLYGVSYYNVKLDGGNASSNYDLTNVTGIQNNLDVINKSNITTNGILSVGGNFTHSTTGSSSLGNDLDVIGSSSFSNGSFNINTKYFTTGDLTLSSGTLTNSSSTTEITNAGGWTKNGGTFTTTSGTVLFSGTVNQALGGTQTTSFVNLTTTNTVSVTVSASPTVTGVLTLTSGKIITGSNKVIVSSTGSVSRTSGYVYGNLQRNIATGTNVAVTFDIGGSANYSPVTLTFASVTVTGDVTASATETDHPQISSSLLSSAKSVNRYWTLSNSATTFTNYSAVFTFVSGDVDGSASTSNLLVGNYSSSWSYPTTGTRTSTSTQSTGLTAFGDFALAECSTPSLVITNPSAVCFAATVDITASSVTAGSSSGLTLTYWTDNGASSSLSTPAAVAASGTYYIKGATTLGCYSIQPVTVTIYSALAGGSVGSDQSICYNATPSGLSSVSLPTGGTGSYTYQWQSSPDNSAWSNVSGATSSTYSPSSSITSTTYYRRTATSGSCGSANTSAVTVTVYSNLAAGSVGSDQSICYNTTPSGLTSVSLPTGGTGSYTYQWQSSPDNSAWSNVSGATSSTYSPSSSITSTTYYRRTTTSGSCGSANTNAVTVTVYSNLAAGSVGSDQSICYNATPSGLASVSLPTGGTGSYTYQWQSSPDNSAWSNVSGATSSTYSPSSLTSTTYYRRTATSGSCGSANTSAVTVTVYSNLAAGSVGSDQSICYNATPSGLTSVSLPTGGTGSYTYQWQSSPDNSAWSNVSGATSSTYSPSSSLTSTTYYRRTATSGSCGSANTSAVTVTVYSNLTAGSVGSDQSICYNATPSGLTNVSLPTGGTGSYTYQWQSSPDNSTWSNVSGATSSTYSPSSLTSTKYYRRTATSGSCGSANTSAVTITVYSNLAAGSVGSDQSICYNATPSGLTSVSLPTGGTGSYTYQWQSSPDNSAWSNVSGATSSTYSPSSSLTSTTYYRRTASSGTCGSANTSAVTVTVYSNLAAGSVGSSQSICYNTTPSGLTSVSLPTGGTGSYTYQWQSSPDNSVWSNVSGATSTTYSPSSNLTGTTYYRRTATSGSCGSASTSAVTVTVYSDLVAGSVGSDQTVCVGSSPAALTNSATPTGGTGSYTYQWQSSINNSTWTNIIGATSNVYSPGSILVTTYYRRAATSGSCGTAYTSSVTATTSVNQTVSLTIASGSGTSVCSGSSVDFTATPVFGGASPSYQWKLNGTDTGTNSATFTTTSLSNGDIVNCQLSSNYACISGSNLATSNSITMLVKVDGTWSGVDPDWSNAANWCGGVPTTTTDVIIPSGTTFSPQISNEASVRDIIINSGATLSLIGTNNLNVAGNFVNNSGTFVPGSGSVTFNGLGAQTIGGTVATQTFTDIIIDKASGTLSTTGSTTAITAENITETQGDFTAPATLTINNDLDLTAGAFTAGTNLYLKGDMTNNGATFMAGTNTVTLNGTATQYISGSKPNSFYNLTVSNSSVVPGVSIESNQNLVNVLTLGNNVVVDADGSGNTAIFKLLSSSDSPTGDASIAKLPSGAQVTGKVTVQRYMSIEGASSGRIYRYISSPVQNGTVADIQNEIPVTGSFTGTSVCSSCGTTQSMFYYDESVTTDFNHNGTTDYNDGYKDFPDASNMETLIPGVGYSIFVRGNLLTSALWDIRGVINSGNVAPITIPLSYTSSGNLSNDGFNLIGNPFPSAIDWNASSGWTKANLDGAVYISDNGYSPARYATWNGVVGTNGGSRYIAMGQAFWVKANGSGTPTLQADENVKVAGTQTTFFREATPTSLMRITLVKGKLKDETVIHFREDATDGFDAHADAIKMVNTTINISSRMASGKNLAINSMPSLLCATNIPLTLQNTAKGNYRFDFSQFDTFAANVAITLVDSFTNKSIDVRKTSSYAFSITTSAASFAANRFTVKFKPAAVNNDFSLSAASEVCEGKSVNVQITDPPVGATYVVMAGGKAVSSQVTSDGGSVSLEIFSQDLIQGANAFTVQSSLCGTTVEKNTTITIEKIFAITTVKPDSTCGEGRVTLGATGAPDNGSYNWYESESASDFIADQHGDSLNVNLVKSKTWYVAAVNTLGCEGARVAVKATIIEVDAAAITIEDKTLVSNYAEGNQWYFNNTPISEATAQSFVPAESGVYSVEVSSHGCTTRASQEYVVTGVENILDKMVRVFPNPVDDHLTIQLPGNYTDIEQILILNELGVTVGVVDYAMDGGKLAGEFRMNDFKAGVYIVQVKGRESVANVKIMKK